MNILITKKESSLTIPETINFKELIGNSLTLSPDAKSEMIDFINSELNEQQQQIYVRNLYMCMNFNPTTDFPVNLDHVYKDMGFANKGNAMKTIKSNFTKDEDYKTVLFPREKNLDTKDLNVCPEETNEVITNKSNEDCLLVPTEKQTNRGGHNHETIMLNIDTYKTLCMLVKTPQGKEIRKYYVKLENIYNNIIKKEIENTKNLLVENKLLLIQKDIDLQEKDKDHILKLKLNKHQVLIDKFKNKNCVYAADICDNYIKIGSTENIEETCIRHITTYGKCIYLDIFECDNFREVERNILIDDKISNNLYRQKINGHVSREVVKLSNILIYLDIVEIIKKYVNQLDLYISPEIIELKRINFFKYLISEKNFTLNDIKELSKIQFNDNLIDNTKTDDNHDNKRINDEINIEENIEIKLRPRRLNLSKQINQIDPVKLTVLKTYNSLTHLLNENPDFTKTQINRSIKNDKVYKNFRWNYIDDEINQTNITKRSTQVESISKLNNDKTKILESYSTKKELKTILKLPDKKMDKVINNKERYNNYYYIKKSECPNNLLESINFEIKQYVPNCSKKIKQINPISKNEVIFNSLTEACTMYGINSKTITENITNKTVYCGSLWEYV